MPSGSSNCELSNVGEGSPGTGEALRSGAPITPSCVGFWLSLVLGPQPVSAANSSNNARTRASFCEFFIFKQYSFGRVKLIVRLYYGHWCGSSKDTECLHPNARKSLEWGKIGAGDWGQNRLLPALRVFHRSLGRTCFSQTKRSSSPGVPAMEFAQQS